MSGAVGTAATLVLFPIGAAGIGAGVASLRPPGPRLSSAIQHFAAGVVFAAVAGEVLPDLRNQHSLGLVAAGFALGVAALIGLETLARRAEGRARNRGAALPIGLLVTIGIDLLIDGLLVGLGASLGEGQGRVLTIALTLEVLFLALSLTVELTERGASRAKAAVVPVAVSLTMAVGAVGGATVLGNASHNVLAAVLAFGAAALLYLVTEELLTEAHEAPDSPAATAMFFVGFLAIFILEGR